VAKLQNVESRRRIKYVEKQLAGVATERPCLSSAAPCPMPYRHYLSDGKLIPPVSPSLRVS